MAGKGIRSLISNLSRLAGIVQETIGKIQAIKRTGHVDGNLRPISIVRIRGRCFLVTDEDLINLNWASAEVLSSVPGLGPSRVAAIIAARGDRTKPEQMITSIGDLKRIIPSLPSTVLAQCANTCTVISGYREITLDEANEAHQRAANQVARYEVDIVGARHEALRTLVDIRKLVDATRGRGTAQATYTGVGPDIYRPLRLPRTTFERHGRLIFRHDFDQLVADARVKLEG